MNDKILTQIIRRDFAGLPDPATEQRLQHAFMLKSAGYKTKQNSFSGFFDWLLAPRQIIAKMAFAVIVAAFFLIRPGLNPVQRVPAASDSARVDQSRVQDSAFLQRSTTSNDSVF